MIEHESGTRSTFFATNAHHTNADVDLEITGRDGVVTLGGGQVLLSNADGSRVIASDSQATGERSYWGRGHALLIDDFYARLDEPEPFWIGPAQGLEPLRVLREVYSQSDILPTGAEL